MAYATWDLCWHPEIHVESCGAFLDFLEMKNECGEALGTNFHCDRHGQCSSTCEQSSKRIAVLRAPIELGRAEAHNKLGLEYIDEAFQTFSLSEDVGGFKLWLDVLSARSIVKFLPVFFYTFGKE